MSLPRLKPDLARDVLELYRDERFRRLWDFLLRIEEEWRYEILNSRTPTAEREVLVRAREMLGEEVLKLPQVAQIVINIENKINAGQATSAPA